ncbi:hypothetical protein ES702_05450 [subsurface metagenome]
MVSTFLITSKIVRCLSRRDFITTCLNLKISFDWCGRLVGVLGHPCLVVHLLYVPESLILGTCTVRHLSSGSHRLENVTIADVLIQ